MLSAAVLFVLPTCTNKLTGALFSEISITQNGKIVVYDGEFDCGSVAVGDQKEITFSVQNTGDGVLELTGDPKVTIGGTHADMFSIAADPPDVIAPGEEAQFSLTFSPTTVGKKQATITVKNNAMVNSTYVFKVTGTGTAAPEPEINVKQDQENIPSGSTFDFGNIAAGDTGDVIVFTIQNTGTATLSLPDSPPVYLGGTDASAFSITSLPDSSVEAGGETYFGVVFSPDTSGDKSAVVYIPSNDADEDPYQFTITGAAETAPEITVFQGTVEIESGGSYDAGFVSIAAGSQVSFFIRNNGTGDLNLTGNPKVVVGGENADEFTVFSQPASTVIPGGASELTIQCSPDTAGEKSATFTIINNDEDEKSYVFTITCEAVSAPTVTITSEEPAVTSSSSFQITITFSEPVSGFTLPDIAVGNCTAANFQAQSTTVYTVYLSPDGDGTVTAMVPAAVAQSLANSEDNVASLQFSRVYDITPPIPGNSGVITIGTITEASIYLSWFAASDNTTTQAELQYLIYYAETDNIDTYENAELHGTVFGGWANKTNDTVTGLDAAITYYLNIFVRDAGHFVSAYQTASAATIDTTAPVPGGGGAISVGTTGESTVALSWSEASDNAAHQTDLRYRVYYSAQDNIDTYGAAQTHGTPAGDWAYKTNETVTGLQPARTYYFNVFVRDTVSNVGAYTIVQALTIDETPPTRGGNGVIAVTAVNEGYVSISWGAAVDNATPQGDLEYLVYYSAADNIDTYADAQANGVSFGLWSNKMAETVTGLDPAQQYYFNVFVRDGSALVTAYDTCMATTTDETPPNPGNGGILNIESIAQETVSLSWYEAVDNATDQENLLYRIYYSTNDNIATYANAENNGTPFGAWEHKSDETVTGLQSAQAYYFNVFVRDEAMHVASYTSKTATTIDISAPLPGGGGVISIDDAGETSVSLSWLSATDNATQQADLDYIVYYSSQDDISDYAATQANGTAFGTWVNKNEETVTGLDPGSQYYFNVFVRDEEMLVSAYIATGESTTDETAPVPGGGGAISVGTIAETTVALSWDEASDNASGQAALTYIVYFSSDDNIDTYAQAQTNGFPFSDWENKDSDTITGLDAATMYYFNVFVRDEAENIAAYTAASAETIDSTDPVPGDGGTITVEQLDESSCTLSWVAASDNVTDQSYLEYRVMRSNDSDLSTVIDALANGTPETDWTADLTSCNITGLTEGTDYYFNALVRDEAGNTSIYAMLGVTTHEVIALTIYFDEPGDETITLDQTGESPFGPTDFFDVEVTESFTWYMWFLDGDASPLGPYNGSSSVSVNCSYFSDFGPHTLSVAVETAAGGWYSKTLHFSVENDQSE